VGFTVGVVCFTGRTSCATAAPHVPASDIVAALIRHWIPLNDLPDEMLVKILSHLGPEDVYLIIAKVCERWNVLAKDMVLWKSLSYKCDWSFNISRIKKVRCTALLGFRTNCIMNFAPSSVLKVQNPKEHLRSCISFHPE